MLGKVSKLRFGLSLLGSRGPEPRSGPRPYDFGLMFEEAIRVRIPLIDLWLIFLVIILLVLVVRELIY